MLQAALAALVIKDLPAPIILDSSSWAMRQNECQLRSLGGRPAMAWGTAIYRRAPLTTTCDRERVSALSRAAYWELDAAL